MGLATYMQQVEKAILFE